MREYSLPVTLSWRWLQVVPSALGIRRVSCQIYKSYQSSMVQLLGLAVSNNNNNNNEFKQISQNKKDHVYDIIKAIVMQKVLTIII